MTSLIHIIYSSAATSPMSQHDLIGLLAKAREKNTRLGVTGMLLYVEGSFLQVLEGEPDIVDPLFERIAGDQRHSTVVTIIREPIARRSFDEWSMGFANVTADELASVDGLNDFFVDHRCLDQLGPGRTKKLLRAFEKGRWRSHPPATPAPPAPAPAAPAPAAPAPATRESAPAPRPPAADATERLPVSFAFQPVVDLAELTVVSHEVFEVWNAGTPKPAGLDPSTLARRQMDIHEMALGMAARLGVTTGLTLNFTVHRCDEVGSFMRQTVDAAERFGLNPDKLTLELDHDQVLEDPQWFASLVREHRACGMRILIDHFGAGRSGHYLIDTYQPDGIALNEGLVRDIETNGSRQALVRGIIQTTDDLGIDVVAKHVERRSELDWFRAEGVDQFQGTLFAAPLLEELATEVLIPTKVTS